MMELRIGSKGAWLLAGGVCMRQSQPLYAVIWLYQRAAL